ncbi:dCTP deaminase [Heterostelium album PN500]|uniref:dCTP deaminase n=1 Tax=Heterostelium pallidum (strain ATCC 26659 / Pp 5 / PN500) TaxID=670386 RepID=D3B676_HETP5|nr:dCTP deaminase [Heterostelium album PN500]EFA83374.1 dCTP deaminase [Heterostelium album PN500]|eukprot:XP_020435491.1 dCTP deaminase [Heterostelium album PN500]
MTVLSRDEIFKAIDSGDIKIVPFDKNAVGCASVDLTLSNEFRVFSKECQTIKVTADTNYQDITTKFILKPGETFLLEPNTTCLAITEERVELSTKYCGLLEGRSRFARLGLFVHISAGFMMPNIKNRQVLEIFNASSNRYELTPGTKICQFVFMELKGEASYSGRFQENVL